MQGKGLIRFFLIFMLILSVYTFALFLPTNVVENRAETYASQQVSSLPEGERELARRTFRQKYLDSMSNETVLNVGFRKFNYMDLKKQQLALGLDLKGGMSVVMQVDLKDLVVQLSDKSEDENFLKALTKATENQVNSQDDYITLFVSAFREIAPDAKLAPIFQSELREEITFETSNSEVASILREKANETVGLTFTRLKQRIDKFGVTQPNVSLDENTDRILVELPGVEDAKRARDLLQATAELEFFDTYRIYEIQDRLVNGNTRLKARAAALKGDTSATDVATLEDSLNLLNANRGPLLSKLSLNGQIQAGQYAFQRCVIGIANVSDTAEINKMLASPEVSVPRDLRFLWDAKAIKDQETGSSTDDILLYAVKVPSSGEALLQGDMISTAGTDLDPETNAYTVSLGMKATGRQAWARMTQAAVGENREVAIVLDNEVVSSPSVQSAITSGNTQITGNFTPQEAQDLANVLQVGKLPAKTQIIQEAIVGPSLGQKNINSSLTALAAGLIILLGFMVFYYGSGGIISIIALLLNLLFVVATLASLGTVLTLPGIAGLILTIGMAVDANVIIYERIREELRDGKSMKLAIADGFKASYSAIIDANVTTILTAMVLFYFGLGPIKGFAAVLIIGVVSSLFTAVLAGRLFIDWWTGRGNSIAFSTKMTDNAFSKMNFDFIKARKTSYVVSGAIILAGLISFATVGFQLGVDFKGGYSYVVEFEKTMKADDIRAAMTTPFGKEPVVKMFGNSSTYEITTDFMIKSADADADKKVLTKLFEGVAALVNDASLTEENFVDRTGKTILASSGKVGPTIADDITQSAFYSAIFALLLIFLYIFVRFRQWQYSLGAVAALFHDVLIVLALFSLGQLFLPFSLEIDQVFIGAILTVIGYSINDTVVVFDRIREFVNAYTRKDKKEVFNLAVNNTISRTIITSLTTLFVVLILFLFGGGSIRGFAFALLVGILVGTYSSVFIATPIVYDLTGDLKAKEVGQKTTKYGGRAIEKKEEA
ncbi:MAG: protein translocase subunit SecDF [Saprospiraceae bacterium]